MNLLGLAMTYRQEEELTVLSREVKQRKDSLHEFEKAGREDLVEKIRTELKYVELYMPKQLSEEGSISNSKTSYY